MGLLPPPSLASDSDRLDVSHSVVGWQVSTSLRTDLALDALDMGLRERHRAGQDTTGLIRHSDAGVQYRAIHYTERLAEQGAVASVGTVGDSYDSYDNAMAEAFNSLFKAECIRNPMMRSKGGWASVRGVEIAVAEYIDWFNHRRLHGEIGQVPPAEFEATHWASHDAVSYVGEQVPIGAGSRYPSLHKPGALHLVRANIHQAISEQQQSATSLRKTASPPRRSPTTAASTPHATAVVATPSNTSCRCWAPGRRTDHPATPRLKERSSASTRL